MKGLSPTMLGRTLTEVGGRAVNKMAPHLVNYASRARYQVKTRLPAPGFCDLVAIVTSVGIARPLCLFPVPGAGE